jgi:hypothetical protein
LKIADQIFYLLWTGGGEDFSERVEAHGED